jgi:TRAP-type C4-dicarboxylate transport system substrate-binding protein
MAVIGTLLASAPISAQEKPSVRFIGGTTGIPEGTAGYEKWMIYRDRVAELSGGEVQLTPMVSGELGSEENILNGLRRGRIQVANLSGLVIGSLVPEAALLQAPYLFDSTAQADYVYDTVLSDVFTHLLVPYGLTFLSWDEVGFHHVYGKTPIRTPDDLNGIRFRVSSGIAARLFAEALSADVIPLSFTENIIGLQTGLVDAGANATILYAGTGIAEEAPYLTLTGHMLATNFIITSTSWLASLSPEHQAIVRQGWLPIDESRAMSRAEEADFMGRQNDIGFTAQVLSPAQRKAWQHAVQPVTQALTNDIGGQSQDILNAIQAAKIKFAAEKSR